MHASPTYALGLAEMHPEQRRAPEQGLHVVKDGASCIGQPYTCMRPEQKCMRAQSRNACAQSRGYAPDESLHVVKDRAPLAHGGNDGREVVVRENHVARLLGDLRARDAHCNADVCQAQRGRVVDTVTCKPGPFESPLNR